VHSSSKRTAASRSAYCVFDAGCMLDAMLEHTFIHARGVGRKTERRLWNSGARSWDAFLDLHDSGTLGDSRFYRIAPQVHESRRALRRRDIEFFSQRLPSGEMWRVYPDFADQAAYVDIETTGLSSSFDRVTVIGLYDSHKFRVFVRGKNLDDFRKAAAKYPLLVSFNGATFDLPFLRAAFRGFEPRAHLDLRYPLKRLRYTGGLKEIERLVGIKRPRHLRDIDGFEAVILWEDYQRGNRGALERLIEYMRQDVINLVPLAALVAKEMPGRLGFPSHR